MPGWAWGIVLCVGWPAVSLLLGITVGTIMDRAGRAAVRRDTGPRRRA